MCFNSPVEENIKSGNKIRNNKVHHKNSWLTCEKDQLTYVLIPLWSFPYVNYSEANSSHDL